VTRQAVYGECAERIRSTDGGPDMSPTEPSTKPLRPIIAVLAAIAVAACSGKTPPSVAPTVATVAPAPIASPAIETANDAGLVVGRSGDEGLQLILAGSGERIFPLPKGAPGKNWSRVVSAAVTGGSTTIRDLTLPDMESSSQTIDGAWRLPIVGLDPNPVGVSDDGKILVLVDAGTTEGASARKISRFVVVDRTAAAAARVVELAGQFEYDALSPDGSILYVVEHLAGPPDGHYQVRAVETATGVLRVAPVADKNQGDEAMAGWPIAQVRRPDGMVFTLYRGADHPFIHALNSVDAWALCIDLPTTGANDPAAASDWGLTATIDGRSIIAANATLGLAVAIPVADLAIVKSVTFAPSASSVITLAKFGHDVGGEVGRRVVASPSGSVVYAAGPGGIVSIATSDLSLQGRFLEGVPVDAMAVTIDGGTIYALIHAGGRIVRLDAGTGRIVGEVPGEGYDRLAAVVPW
jgi:hypothetical protein